MQERYEHQYHLVEKDHWWFVARRELLRQLVLQALPNRQSRILEVGCSAGLFMDWLRRDGYTRVQGIDISEDGIERCRKQGLDAQVMDAQRLAFPDASLDLLTASDVLEHLADEAGALREWYRVLKPGGWLIVFVPAFMFLWTAHDVANRHFRRYRRPALIAALEGAGFRTERSSYWNAFLFPPIALGRVLKRLIRSGALPNDGGTGDLFLPPKPVNASVLNLLRLENRLFCYGMNWPAGVSVMVQARKPEQPR